MDFEYINEFEIDIENLIDAVKNVCIYTEDGEKVKNEILSKLYNI